MHQLTQYYQSSGKTYVDAPLSPSLTLIIVQAALSRILIFVPATMARDLCPSYA